MPDRRTIRTHAVAVALVSWTLLIWVQAVPGAFDRFGTLRGVDFLQFYAAGKLILSGDGGALYDWERFASVVRSATPGAAGALFYPVYPPQIALWFAPFAALPYFGGLAAWVALSAALYGAAAWVIWRFTPGLRAYGVEATMLAVAFPPFLQLLAHGQAAAPATLLLAAAWVAYRHERPFWMGIALGSLLFKPQFGLFGAMALLLLPGAAARARVAAGIAVAALAQAVLVASLLDFTLLVEYLQSLTRAASMADAFEPKRWQMHGLSGAALLLFGRSPLTLAVTTAGSVLILLTSFVAARRSDAPEVRFAVVCLTALALNPHLYVYDLVLLGVPLALVASRLAAGWAPPRKAGVAWTAYALVWLPMVGPLAQVTRLQLTAPAMVALIWLLYRAAPAPPIARPRSAPATHPA